MDRGTHRSRDHHALWGAVHKMSRIKILIGMTDELLTKLDMVSMKMGLSRTAYIITVLQSAVSRDLKKVQRDE
jgi:metal-responsive CopG/Arc/MetJ family transcriptional regulator